jgi:hypothetical protein
MDVIPLSVILLHVILLSTNMPDVVLMSGISADTAAAFWRLAALK